jgi:hypothetical protein
VSSASARRAEARSPEVAPGTTAPPSGRSIRIQALGNMRVEPRADTLDGMYHFKN